MGEEGQEGLKMVQNWARSKTKKSKKFKKSKKRFLDFLDFLNFLVFECALFANFGQIFIKIFYQFFFTKTGFHRTICIPKFSAF